MEIKDAKKCINETINEYKFERNMDAYANAGVEPMMRVYQLFAPNLAGIEAIVLYGGLYCLGCYELYKDYHFLTEEINTLKRFRSNIKYENLDNITKEELEEHLIKRKTLIKK